MVTLDTSRQSGQGSVAKAWLFLLFQFPRQRRVRILLRRLPGGVPILDLISMVILDTSRQSCQVHLHRYDSRHAVTTRMIDCSDGS